MTALALAACGDDDDHLSRDAGRHDAGHDAGRDAATDAAMDAAHDDAMVVVDAGDTDAGDDCNFQDPCTTGVEIPASVHYVQPGMCARAVALDQGRLRQITFAPNGDLFGVTVDGEIYRYRDADCDGAFSSTERVLWADTGGNGTSVHIDATAGYLYASAPTSVKRWRYTAASEQGTDLRVVVSGIPTTGNHTFATAHAYDGWLYVQSGSEDNVSAPMSPAYDNNRSLLKRFRLSDFDANPAVPLTWSNGAVVARGLRNTVGFTRHRGQIYGVVNGIDDLHYNGVDIHDDNPGEMITRIEQDADYGYPYCFPALNARGPGDVLFPAGTLLHTELAPASLFTNPHDDTWCAANATPPDTLVDAHSAPLDIVFLEQATQHLLAPWVDGAFVALHGSWNRDTSTGHKVIWVPFDEQGRGTMPIATDSGPVFNYEVVFGGGNQNAPLDGAWDWTNGSQGEDGVRPVGVAISPIDGALYVSSDNAPVFGSGDTSEPQGAIYRIARRSN